MDRRFQHLAQRRFHRVEEKYVDPQADSLNTERNREFLKHRLAAKTLAYRRAYSYLAKLSILPVLEADPAI